MQILETTQEKQYALLRFLYFSETSEIPLFLLQNRFKLEKKKKKKKKKLILIIKNLVLFFNNTILFSHTSEKKNLGLKNDQEVLV